MVEHIECSTTPAFFVDGEPGGKSVKDASKEEFLMALIRSKKQGSSVTRFDDLQPDVYGVHQKYTWLERKDIT